MSVLALRAGSRAAALYGMGPGVGQEGWLGWCSSGFLSFCVLFVICPTCLCTQLFLVPYSFFVFSLEEMFVQGRAQQRSVPSPTCLNAGRESGGRMGWRWGESREREIVRKTRACWWRKGCRDGWTDRCTREQRTAADAPASRQLSPSVPPLDPSPPGSGASDNG